MTRGGKDCGGEMPRAEKDGEEGLKWLTLQQRGTIAEGGEEERQVICRRPNY